MAKGRTVLWIFGFLVVVFSVYFVSAQSEPGVDYTHLISNSEDWKDVYSVMHYGRLKGVGVDFLASTRHGPLLINGLSKTNDVRVISSNSRRFVINYDSDLRNAGFADADEITVNNANLELIDDLPEITNFVIVGNTYGYDAIAVAPYAVLNDAWVFLVDRANIDDVDAIMSNRQVDDVLVYGFLERDIRDTLEKYDPIVVDNGDRFEDNIEIVERYLEIKPVKQITLTNGEFIEKSVMSGTEPVLFTGKENVPDQIRNYITSSDIEVGVLIGPDLVGAATNIRRSTGISVIVKFARGARAPTGAIAAVEGLDFFYLPIPILDLDIHSARYNAAASQLELTYKSNSNVPLFFRGTITPITEEGDQSVIGDVDPIFMAPDDFKTVVYQDLDFAGEELTLDVFTLYGDSPRSLEKILEERVEVESVNIIDACEITIEGIKYSKPKEAFIIEVVNIGEVDCWVDIELEGVLIDGVVTTLGSEGGVEVRAGKKAKIVIEQEMADEDLEDNDFVNVVAYHGEREDSLIKVLRGRFELKIESISYASIGLIVLGLVVVITIVILLILWKRKKDDDDW